MIELLLFDEDDEDDNDWWCFCKCCELIISIFAVVTDGVGVDVIAVGVFNFMHLSINEKFWFPIKNKSKELKYSGNNNNS